MKDNKASILLIYTGGTIGMKENVEEQSLCPFDFSQILEEVPEIQKFTHKVDIYSFNPIIDSSDVEPSLWVKLAKLIQEKYDNYDGFVILHGTDTMAYSASALSFMLDGLSKAVVFTGSQLPIGAARTDGKENLISSVEIAAARDKEGRALVPEVCIYFDSVLSRGNRTKKINADNFRAFSSPNYPALASAGIHIKYHEEFIRKPLDWYQSLSISTDLDSSLAIVKLHPGLKEELISPIFEAENIRAIILETYGSGNAPSKKSFLELIEKANKKGKIIVNISQCLVGSVDMNIYDNGKSLLKAGVINGYDSTLEAALCKLYYLMGKYKDNQRVKLMMERNLKGEISK